MKEILEKLQPKPVKGEKVCANCRYRYPALVGIDGELRGVDVCSRPGIKKDTGGAGASFVINENVKEVGCEKWR